MVEDLQKQIKSADQSEQSSIVYKTEISMLKQQLYVFHNPFVA
jgi:hypothetical protein